MMRSRWSRWFAVLLGLVVAGPLAAAPDQGKLDTDSPLAQVPAGSPIVVSLHGFKRTTDRLIKMVTNAMPDLGPKLEKQMETLLKEGFFQDRKIAGLKDDGYIFLVFPTLPNPASEQQDVAVIARVTDYKAFRDGFLKEDERKNLKEDKNAGYEVATVADKDVYFINRGDYVVVAAEKKTAQKFAGKQKAKGLNSSLAKNVADSVLGSDIAVYVDLAAINKQYGEKIKSLRKDIDDTIDRLEGAELPGLDKNSIGLIKLAVKGLLQLFDDSQNTLLAIDFRPEGFALGGQLNVRDDTKSNGFLSKMKPSSLASIKTLPHGYTSYMATEFGPEAFKAFEPVLKALLASADEETDKEGAKVIKDAVDGILAAGPKGLLSASALSTGGEGLQVWQYADPNKAAAAQLKLFKALKGGGKYQFAPIKGQPVVKEGAESFRGTKLTFVSLKWDLDKMFENLPVGGGEAADTFKKMIGETMNLWFGVVDNTFVQVMAKDWKTAEKHLTQYFTKTDLIGDAKHKAFAKARGHLPKEATMVSLTNVPSYAEFYAKYFHAMLKNFPGFEGKEPGKASKQPSYFGMAVTMKAGQGSFALWIPGDAAKEFRRVFEPMFKMDD